MASVGVVGPTRRTNVGPRIRQGAKLSFGPVTAGDKLLCNVQGSSVIGHFVVLTAPADVRFSPESDHNCVDDKLL